MLNGFFALRGRRERDARPIIWPSGRWGFDRPASSGFCRTGGLLSRFFLKGSRTRREAGGCLGSDRLAKSRLQSVAVRLQRVGGSLAAILKIVLRGQRQRDVASLC